MKKLSVVATTICLLGMSAVQIPQAHATSSNVCRQVFSTVPHFLSSRGERVAFETSGPLAAETVVIFLNGIDRNLHQWDYIARQVTRDEKVPTLKVQLDLLGQGETSKLNPAAASEIAFQDQIRLLNELIVKQGWNQKKIVLIGHSYGGGIAARYVRDYPNTVEKVLMVSPFVDNLEFHQLGFGPAFAFSKFYADLTGTSNLYNETVLGSSSLSMAAAWPMYSITNGITAKLTDVLALTRGNRSLEMSKSLEMSGSTKFALVRAAFDEMVPHAAQGEMWGHVPYENRAFDITLPSLHDSPKLFSGDVARSLLRLIEKN